jgi:hypothetical protein
MLFGIGKFGFGFGNSEAITEYTPAERVTDGGFDNAGAWTKIEVSHLNGDFVVSGSGANFSSRTEYRLEQAAAVPNDADCDVSFDWVRNNTAVEIKVYLNGTTHTVIDALNLDLSGTYSGTLAAGSSNSNIGIQCRGVLSSRTATIDNFSVIA